MVGEPNELFSRIFLQGHQRPANKRGRSTLFREANAAYRDFLAQGEAQQLGRVRRKGRAGTASHRARGGQAHSSFGKRTAGGAGLSVTAEPRRNKSFCGATADRATGDLPVAHQLAAIATCARSSLREFDQWPSFQRRQAEAQERAAVELVAKSSADGLKSSGGDFAGCGQLGVPRDVLS